MSLCWFLMTVVEYTLAYNMKSQQLFEIDRQINQIRRDLQQRQEKVTEWDVPLAHILKDRSDKDFYLSKKYTKARLDHYLDGENDPTQASKLLQQHTQDARAKVLYFRNDLRQLQELLQRRNVFRLKGGRRSCQLPQQQHSGKKEFSKTSYEPSNEQPHKRNERDHSAFATLKGERLLEVYQEGKQRGEEPLGHLKRFLGVGIESTPFFGWAEKKKQAERSLRKSKPRPHPEGKQPQLKLHQQLQKDVEGHRDIYLSSGNPKRQQFEQRLKRVMLYSQGGTEGLRSWGGLRI